MARHLAPTNYDDGPGRIDSVQNGLLLTSTLHSFWDTWVMSINPVAILNHFH
jgi:hypothetical protein